MIEDLMQVLRDDGNDPDGFLKRFMGRMDFYEKYLRRFLEDTCFEKITVSLKEGNVEEAFTASHTLKGIAANLGLTRLYDVDVVLVEKLRANNTEGIQEDYDAIKEEYERVIGLIRQYL